MKLPGYVLFLSRSGPRARLVLQVDPATIGRPAADEFAAARFPELIARFNETRRRR
jgi:hypothetical protein